MIRTLPAFFSTFCAKFSDRVLCRFEGESTTYGEIDRQARALARGLWAAGVRPGAHVGLLLGNRPEWIAAAYAIALVGGVTVPLSTFAKPEERNFLFRHSDISVLLFQRSLAGRDFLEEIAASEKPAQLRQLYCLGLDKSHDAIFPWKSLELEGELPHVSVSEEDTALIIYTSGTTAEPKGIVHRHRAPVLRALHFADYLRLGPEDRMWTVQPFFWAAGIAVSLGATMASGGCLILQEIFEPKEALDLLERERATCVRAWPHQEKAMAEHPSLKGRDLSSINKLNFSSPLASAIGHTVDKWGTQGGYGLSETFTVACDLPADAPAELRRTTSGRPLPGMDLRIVDGEIVVKGDTLMVGYHKQSSPLDADGFFHTQDSGYFDDAGLLHWTGRMSAMIKTGGANVSPLEIEKAMIGFPGVRIAVALGAPHPTLGEMVVLCIVPTQDAVDCEKVRQFLRDKLAAYKVPRQILVFRPDEIELTGTQKVKLDRLRDAVAERLRECV